MKKKRKCRRRSAKSESMSKSIGFSVGGAKDVNTFRDNILKNSRIPQLESISFEGVYYDYFFDTKENELGTNDVSDNNDDDDKKEGNVEELPLFYPSYMYSKSTNPDSLRMAANANKATKKTTANDMISDEADDEQQIYDFHLDDETTTAK